MKIKGVMNGNPMSIEGSVIDAIGKLCEVYGYGKPEMNEEDDAVLAENETGTVLFLGTPDEIRLFKEASKLVAKQYERILKKGGDSPSAQMIRIGLENVKGDIDDAMVFIKHCAPQSSLSEAFGRMAESGYAH